MRKKVELTSPESCMSRAEQDEMTFVLLGRDVAAPSAIKYWVFERVRLGKNSYLDPQITEALNCANTMERERVLGAPRTETVQRAGGWDERGWLMELQRIQKENSHLRQQMNEEYWDQAAFAAHLKTNIQSYRPFRKCETLQDVFNIYDSMEGRALAAEERLKILGQEV